jgi:uncharacterized protein YcbX
MNPLFVSEITIYPIKSCGGIAIQSAEFDDYGIKTDRMFMIVDENSIPITQRDVPELALVKTELERNSVRVLYRDSSILIPISDNKPHELYTSVWESAPLSVADVGAQTDEFFADIINRKCRLVRRSQSYNRLVASGIFTGQHRVAFVDSHPILIVSRNSVRELNKRLDEPILPDRFRPNIIIDGDCAPFDEDSWSIFQIDNQFFDFGKRCARCTVTTINQQTAQKSKEPLRELANFRRDERGKVCFGAYFTNRNTFGSISTKSTVHIHQSFNNPLT